MSNTKEYLFILIGKVVCGCMHVLALSHHGTLYAWGANCFGQLGIGDEICSNTPQKVTCRIIK